MIEEEMSYRAACRRVLTDGSVRWRWSADCEPFVRELDRLDGDLVSVCIEIRAGNLRRPRIRQCPRHRRCATLVEQLDGDRGALPLVPHDALVPVKQLRIAGDQPSLECDVREFPNSRHFDRRERRAVAADHSKGPKL